MCVVHISYSVAIHRYGDFQHRYIAVWGVGVDGGQVQSCLYIPTIYSTLTTLYIVLDWLVVVSWMIVQLDNTLST